MNTIVKDVWEDDRDPKQKHDGIGRLIFLAVPIGFSMVVVILAVLLMPRYDFEESTATLFVMVSYVLVMWIATIFRLKNIGYSGWWSLALPVPALGLLLFFACLVLPTKYASTMKLDVAAKSCLALFLMLIVIGAASHIPLLNIHRNDSSMKELFQPAIDALEQYRKNESGYPESLDALVPEYLPVVPQCPEEYRRYSPDPYHKGKDGEYSIVCVDGRFVMFLQRLQYDSDGQRWWTWD